MDLTEFVKKKIRKDGESILDKASENGFRDQVEDYKEKMVIEKLDFAFDNSSYYRDLLKDENISSEDIEDIDDFRNKIPLTSIDDLTDNHYQLMAVTRNQIFRGFTDNGKRVLYTKNELENLVSSISAGLRTVGVDKSDRFLITFPKETEWGCPFLVKMAAEKCDCVVRHTDHLTADKQIKEIEDFDPTVIIGSHPYLYTLAKTIDRMGDLSLKVDIDKMIMSRGCVYYPFNEEIRGEVERIYGCDVYDHYGTTETGFAVAIECREKDGLHVNEADFYVEVVDPETKEPLPHGEQGELVITTLNREGMPMIRYRTGDITSVKKSKHGCKSELVRLDGIIGEVDNRYSSSQGLPLI